MLHIQMSRRRDNLETRFTRHGVEVKPEKLSRFAKRHNIGENFRLSVPLNPEGSVRTLPAIKVMPSPPAVTLAESSFGIDLGPDNAGDTNTEPYRHDNIPGFPPSVNLEPLYTPYPVLQQYMFQLSPQPSAGPSNMDDAFSGSLTDHWSCAPPQEPSTTEAMHILQPCRGQVVPSEDAPWVGYSAAHIFTSVIVPGQDLHPEDSDYMSQNADPTPTCSRS
ncbi:hypothetical protein B0T16DRAFT_391200 [Cercophora newfieldiana]|uniref:Uncharacterized protein n=1 Tax=Cercophora newfieldiana TaxID=92897 RepID=A0AA40CQ00_9PEZI|nr:hypothetical protein B0T16DRAFT_391200 [Cercophora newfieldiana]